MQGRLPDLSVMMADLDEEKLLAEVRRRVEEKAEDPMSILNRCRDGIKIVGERFEKGEYFLADLMMSAEILKGVMTVLDPLLTSAKRTGSAGKVVFATVKDDIHNIGKDIAISLVRAEGFEVFDLGINVPPEVIIKKVRDTGSTIVGLSGLITVSYDSMKDTVTALAQAGLRKQVKIMIGGGLVNEEVRIYTGADAWGDSASTAVTLCRKFTAGAV